MIGKYSRIVCPILWPMELLSKFMVVYFLLEEMTFMSVLTRYIIYLSIEVNLAFRNGHLCHILFPMLLALGLEIKSISLGESSLLLLRKQRQVSLCWIWILRIKNGMN